MAFDSNTQAGRIRSAKPSRTVFLGRSQVLVYTRTRISYSAQALALVGSHRRQFSRGNKRSHALDDGADDPYLSAR